MADSITSPEGLNPSGLCMCGCGLPAPICTQTKVAKGFVKGKPMRYIVGHYQKRWSREMVCAVDGCDRPRSARGMCPLHYGRWKTYGDPTVVLLRDLPLEERFWAMVAKGEPNECWEWTGGRTGSGYGLFNLGSRDGPTVVAHRYAYESAVGPILGQLELDHLCRNRGCVNPNHLEPVTHGENMRRADVVFGIRSAATHCPKGHPYDEANTGRWNGRRHCRACAREAFHQRKQRLSLLTSVAGLPEVECEE